MKKAILAGLSGRFYVYYREITEEYDISMIAEEKIENAPSEVTFGYPVLAFKDLDPSGSEMLLIVSQSRCTSILKSLLSLGIPKDRIIIWTPKLYLERSDYKLTVENDASVTAEMNLGSVNVKATLRAYSDFFVFEEIYLKNTYRFSVPKDCILFDIGLNVGLASIFFASKGFIKKIYGFEPFKPTYERAIENIGLNSAAIRDKIETFPYGLGDSNDTRSFVYNKENPGIMRTGQGSVAAKPEDENVETVEIREAGPELIKIMDQYPDAFFAVKMDCEGGEFDIFPNLIKHGAFDRIGYIMMETHDGKEDLLVDMLSNEGFIVYSDRPSTHQTGKLIAVKA